MPAPSCALSHAAGGVCSDKVAGKGCFGASLMLEPQLVADCCAAMAAATHVPITVKCRIGARGQWPGRHTAGRGSACEVRVKLI